MRRSYLSCVAGPRKNSPFSSRRRDNYRGVQVEVLVVIWSIWDLNLHEDSFLKRFTVGNHPTWEKWIKRGPRSSPQVYPPMKLRFTGAEGVRTVAKPTHHI